MPAAVVAQGPNDLEVPLLFFATAQDAHNYLTSKGFAKGANTKKYKTFHDKDIATALYESSDKVTGDFLENSAAKALLRNHYYDGCGEIYEIFVRLIEYGQPIVNWDLD